MQVVSLRRLDYQKPLPRKERSVLYLVPLTILIGILISPLIIAAFIKFDKSPNINAHTVIKTKKNKTILSEPKAQPTKRILSKTTLAKDSGSIIPENSDESKIFAAQFLQSLPPPTVNCQVHACVALTFDDGPNPDSTKQLLDSLDTHLAHASFFEIGSKVKGNEALIKRMQLTGQDIGNHSWSHPSFLDLKPEQIQIQVEKTQQAITSLGLPPPHLFRPPYEDFLLSMQKDIKLPVILWNIDPKDWAENDPQKIATTIEQQIKPGAIIVMHDRLPTAQAVNKVLTDLNNKYQFVTVSKLLNINPDSRGVYIGK